MIKLIPVALLLVAAAFGGSADRQIIEVHDKEQLEDELANAKGKLAVICFQTSQNPQCRMLAPMAMDGVNKNEDQLVMLEVDAEELRAVSKHYGVSETPTFVFIRNEEIVGRVVGADIDLLRAQIMNQLDPNEHSSPQPNKRNQAGNSHQLSFGATTHVVEARNKLEIDRQLAYARRKLVLIFFHSARSPPSELMEPAVADAAERFRYRLLVLKVDVREAELGAVATQFGVESTPTFVFVRNRRTVDRIVRPDVAELKLKIASHLSSNRI